MHRGAHKSAGRGVLTVRALRDEVGHTLPELLVAAVLSLLIAAAGSMLVVVAVKTQPQTSERAGQIQQGRTMLENVTRELRQAKSVTAASSSQVELLTYVPAAACGVAGTGSAQLCRVTYSCNASSCSRTERPPNATTPSRTTTSVSGITGPGVFSAEGTDPLSPAYVGVRLVFPQASGEEAVTLDDGAALRNFVATTGASG